MRIAVAGSRGQLGLALQEVLAGNDLLPIDLPEHDITDLGAITATLAAFRPEAIIHSAALTDVDRCEREPDLAYAVNVLGTRNLVVGALQTGAAFVYVSTDYVFPGREEPYAEYDPTGPLSVYARTKLQGEQVVRDHLQRFYIARTAWMYGDGPRSFVETVLRLADGPGTMQMVTDEVGSPTRALDLARALARLIQVPAFGIHHLSGEGACSRYEWAVEILRIAGRKDVVVEPATGYRRLARVPKRVVLRNRNAAAAGIVMPPWQESLREHMEARRG